ncbi:MAG: hypothetical protein K0S81_539 [Rhodospirillales bacterium]|jgi:hypothetical protein|nr:hypothetical protein [Rhodospirillales bacterium]
MTPLPFLHVAQGDTAAGLLLQATRHFGVPGDVQPIREDLSHGPLGDGRARMAYMKACCRNLDLDFDPDPRADDTDLQWRSLLERVERERPAAVAVWHSDNAADHVFLRMAAHWLRDSGVPLWEVMVPPRDGDHGVAIYGPERLAPMFDRRREIGAEEVHSLALEFLAIQVRPEPVRRFDGAQLHFRPIDAYDDEILGVVRPDWRLAAQVIADLWAAWDDGRNWITDVFVASRLSALIDAGRLEAQGSRVSVRSYQVRLSDHAG